MTVLLWLALILLIAATVISARYSFRFIVGGLGWVFFSIHWFTLPPGYLILDDYFNIGLVILTGLLCLFIAYIMFRARNEKDDKNKRGQILISLTRAVSVAGIIYFMFADIVFLNTWLISLVTGQVIWLLEKIGYPVIAIAWNRLAVNGQIVEIILACTGIESMALFLGLVSSAKESQGSQKFKAFLISVPVIYILNLIRVSFTASAYGFAWFGTPDESFHIAEHMITKAGSTIALIGISYIVLKILPEVADLIDGLVTIMKTDLKKLIASKPL